MATIDWPTDQAFRFATVQAGAEVAMSGWRGFFTGVRETANAGADRLTLIATLAPCLNRADAAKREAFIGHVLSTGDYVRFAAPHRANRLGTLGGSPTVNGAVASGARSLVLAGALSAPNTLLYSSFEIDTNADGLADGWSASTNGTTGSVTPTRGAFTGVIGSAAQRLTISGLGTTSGDSVAAVATTYATVSTGLAYTLAVTQAVDNACQGALRVDWYDATPTFLSSSFTAVVPSTSGMTRQSATFTAPASAAKAIARISVSQRSSATGSVIWTFDGVQLEQAAAASAYAGPATLLPGDFIGIGGNLYQVDYTGATADDAGAMTVPLVLPAPKAISSGAAVTWSAPTGLWQLDLEGLNLQYTAAYLQGGVALPFRQVVA